MKTYNQINEKISSGKAVVLTASEMKEYIEAHGVRKAAKDVDVVTTATFGPMCSSGCFLNFGHSKPKMRITACRLDGVPAYSGIAAVDCYLGATQLRDRDPANSNFPGKFDFGGGYVMEKLVRGEEIELTAYSYGTQEYPLRDLKTKFTIHDLNQAIMVNPRNCYQNYNVATNCSDKRLYTYMGQLEPKMGNLTYCSAGELSPLLNDPLYETIGVGSVVWLAGARGHVFSEGTQHCPTCERTDNDVPAEGAGTLALTADMKKMRPEFVRGCSFVGYGVSLALGIGIPIPVLNERIAKHLGVRDKDIRAQVIDYSTDYPLRTGNVLGTVTYEQLKSEVIEFKGKKITVSSMSSRYKALEICQLLKDDILKGDFLLSQPLAPLPKEQGMKQLTIRK